MDIMISREADLLLCNIYEVYLRLLPKVQIKHLIVLKIVICSNFQ